MAKFQKQNKSKQEIPTSALPDIIFMLLFFFMVTTVLRDTELIVENKLPSATQIQKLEKKSLITHIYIGKPKDVQKFGKEAKIQADDVFISSKEIKQFIQTKRGQLDEVLQPKMIVSLKVNESTKMGIISDVKQELRKANALKVNYSSIPSGI